MATVDASTPAKPAGATVVFDGTCDSPDGYYEVAIPGKSADELIDAQYRVDFTYATAPPGHPDFVRQTTRGSYRVADGKILLVCAAGTKVQVVSQ